MIINCNSTILDLSTPKVMAILNVTPDSFYDGNNYVNESSISSKIDELIMNGADIIDIGAMSSKPGAKEISVAEEIGRLKPALKYLNSLSSTPIISIDTYRSDVIKYAVDQGAHILNDISGGAFDKDLLATVASLKIPYILMHMQGTPEHMQDAPQYKNVSFEILKFFIQKIRTLDEFGINDLLIDPGFGFGKTIEQNYQLLRNLSVFKVLDLPILVGLSRKSMIYKELNITPDAALNGTTALHMLALSNGAKVLRVHDVKEANECIKLHHKYSQI